METPPVTIRPATPRDLGALGRLAAILVETHHEFDPKRFIAAGPQTAQGYGSFLGRQLDEQSVIVLVAESNGVVFGYTYAGVEGPDYMSLRGPAGALYDIVVDPAHRGAGVGRMLLDATLAALDACAARRAWCSRRRRRTSRRSGCLLARAFDGR